MKLLPSPLKFRFLLAGLFSLLIFLTRTTAAQDEKPGKFYHFNGNISVTNNGFSFIPTFSLGKPAAIADLSLGGNRFSFDPQFRFDLNGLRPWSFIFIWRYKVIETEKLLIKPGIHLPAISFRPQTIDINGVSQEQLYTQRWLTPELTVTYKLVDKISIGTYYIHGIGLEKENQTRHSDFISLRMGFGNIRLGNNWYFRWDPQAYYIRLDDLDGFFGAQSFTLGNNKIPFSLSSLMNFSLESENEIPAKEFDWNISLIYSFLNEFRKK
jgi:hypothetical protein